MIKIFLYLTLFINIFFHAIAVPSTEHDPIIINNLFGRDKSPNPAIQSYSGCGLISSLSCSSHSDSDIQMGECWSNARVMHQRSAFFVPFPPGHKSYHSEGGPYGTCTAYSCFPSETNMKPVSNLANFCFFWDGKLHTGQVGGGIQNMQRRDLNVNIGSSDNSSIVSIGGNNHHHHNKTKTKKNPKKKKTKKVKKVKKIKNHGKKKGKDSTSMPPSTNPPDMGQSNGNGNDGTSNNNTSDMPPSDEPDPNQQGTDTGATSGENSTTVNPPPMIPDPNQQAGDAGNMGDNSTVTSPPSPAMGQDPTQQSGDNSTTSTLPPGPDPSQQSANIPNTNDTAPDPNSTSDPNQSANNATVMDPPADPSSANTQSGDSNNSSDDPPTMTNADASDPTPDPPSNGPTNVITNDTMTQNNIPASPDKPKDKSNKKGSKKTKHPKKPKQGGGSGSGSGGGGGSGNLPPSGPKGSGGPETIPKAPGSLVIPMPMICPSNLQNCYSQNYFEPGGKLENYAMLKPTYKGLWFPPKDALTHKFLFCFGLDLGCPTPTMRDLQLHRIASLNCNTGQCKAPSEPIK